MAYFYADSHLLPSAALQRLAPPPPSAMQIRLLLCLSLGLFFTFGCTPRQTDSANTLHVGNGAEPQDLDPHIVTGVSEHHIISTLLEGLITTPPQGEGIAPGVAERWSVSDDGLTWTFHLRPDARWSNLDPLTAHDFVGSFIRILTPALGAQYAYKLHHLVGAEEFNRGESTDPSTLGARALDDHTLQLQFKHRVPYLLEALKHYSWFPVHLPTLERHGGAASRAPGWTRPENFVGNGPFILSRWTPNQRIVVSRSPSYWDAASVRLDEIHFHAVDNADTEERMFRTGRLDVTNGLPPARIQTYQTQHPESFRLDPYYGIYYYRLNLTRPPLDDVRIRRALALAINREEIVTAITRGQQIPAYAFTPPSDHYSPTARLDSGLPDHATRVAEARRLLAEAGYPDGKGLRRIEILYNTLETHQQIAEAIQHMWRTHLGIESTLRNEEWKVYLESQKNLAFDLARAGWIGDYLDPHGFLDLWVSGGGNNQTGYANPDYDHLLAAALPAADESARLAFYQELDALLMRDLPVIPIYYYTRVYALSPRVTGWSPNRLDHRPWKHIGVNTVSNP